MPLTCFVPGCTTGYRSTIKRNKNLGLKNPSLFSVPKNEELQEKWRKAVPREDRVLSVTDRICELHFREECIIKADVTKIFDGSVFVIDRERACLKPGSVPTIFPIPFVLSSEENPPSPCLPANLSSEISEGNVSSSAHPANLSSEISEANGSSSAHPANLSSESSERSPPNHLVLQVKKPPQIENIRVEHVKDIFQEDFSYLHLMQHLEQVQKPNLWWTISFCQNYVICAKWNIMYCSVRKVAVFQDLTTKIFIGNVEVPSLSMKIQSIENLSSLLLKIDRVLKCKCTEHGNCSTCFGYITEDSPDHKQSHRKFCTNCAIHRKKTKDAERLRMRRVKKKKDIDQRLKNVRSQNKRLRAKVLRLKENIKTGRSQCAQANGILLTDEIRSTHHF